MDPNDLQIPAAKRQEFQRLLDKAHKEYRTNLDNLTDAATDEMETILQRSPQDARELVQEYARDASQLANDYYDDLRELWSEYGGTTMPDFDHMDLIDPDRTLWQVRGGFNNTDYNGLTYSQVKAGQSRAGATIEDLWPSFTNLDDAQQFIADMIMESTRLTTGRNMRADPTNPRWARVPRGAVTCAFCLVLASRGFAYLSEESAGLEHSYHEHCDCAIIPSWGKQSLAGYDPDKYLQMYNEAKQGGGDYRQVLQRMRGMYPEQLKDGAYQLSQDWPDNVVRPYAKIWEHIFDNHAPGTSVPGKTRFPAEWSEKKIKWAVMETVVSPDLTKPTDDHLREYRYKSIDGEMVRVWLQVRRNSKNRFTINTAHTITAQERSRLWPPIAKSNPHTNN